MDQQFQKAQARISSTILRVLVLVGLIMLTGTLGYHILLDWNWLDSLYMTIITITTVGYGEIHNMPEGGRVFTMVLILISVGIIAYSASTITSMIIEAEYTRLIWRRRMNERIKKLSGHVIICGFGRTGRAVCEHMSPRDGQVVVVENRPEHVEMLKNDGKFYVEGDATHDDVLERANIRNAKGIISALGEDANNLYLIISARHLNPNITIVAMASTLEAEEKMIRAGANQVASPYLLGGRRMALMLSKPHALKFLDDATEGSNENFEIAELHITPGSLLDGKSLISANISRDVQVVIMGVRKANGQTLFNPTANTTFQHGDTLICFGKDEDVEKLANMN